MIYDRDYDLKVFEFGLLLNSVYVDETHNIYTKVCQISPKNVLFNQTNQTLIVRQGDSPQNYLEVAVGERVPIWWHYGLDTKKIEFRP